MRSILLAAAIEPGATGLILLVSPPLFGWFVLGSDFSRAGEALGRLAGIVLLSLAVACWPAPAPAITRRAALRALLVYNVLATMYLAYLGVRDILVGILLWPAVALHATLSILVACAWRVADRK